MCVCVCVCVFFFLTNKNFIHKTKTELQRGNKGLTLNDKLKTGRAKSNNKKPKNIVQKGPIS